MGLGSAMGTFITALESYEAATKKKKATADTPRGMFTGNTSDEVMTGESETMIKPKEYDTPKVAKAMADNVDKQILDSIAKNEGTYKTGYDTEYSYGKYSNRTKSLEDMTIDEVFAHQKTMKANQRGNSLVSSAIGRYQFLEDTLREEVKQAGLGTDTKFTAAVQDKLILQRLKRVRKYDDWKAGKIDDASFKHNLSKEFASIINPKTGKGYYPGQGAKKFMLPEASLDSRMKRGMTAHEAAFGATDLPIFKTQAGDVVDYVPVEEGENPYTLDSYRPKTEGKGQDYIKGLVTAMRKGKGEGSMLATYDLIKDDPVKRAEVYKHLGGSLEQMKLNGDRGTDIMKQLEAFRSMIERLGV